MKTQPINYLIGQLRGAIKGRGQVRALEILDQLSRKINDMEEVKKELDQVKI